MKSWLLSFRILKGAASAVFERLAEAKAMGDLSENFEYKSAMEDRDFINLELLRSESGLTMWKLLKMKVFPKDW